MTYLAVILGGFALTGFLFWSVGSEFFSSNSPSAIFTQALNRVKSDPRVSSLRGVGWRGFGEGLGGPGGEKGIGGLWGEGEGTFKANGAHRE